MLTRVVCLLALLGTAAAPASAQKPPDTVLLEELTWDELRDLIRGGKTTAIIATAGTEQKGPHMVIGEHRFVMEFAAQKIARALGNAIVAPVITYVPEGSWDNPSGHMTKPGTITLPDDRFMVLLEGAAKSLKAGGFKDIVLFGDHGGTQNGMRDVAAKLNAEWKGSGARAHFIPDYYAKSGEAMRKIVAQRFSVPDSIAGGHAGIIDTSELMYVNPALVRMDKRAPGGGFPNSGVTGDPTKATAELGRQSIQIKIDNAVAQIRSSLAAPVEKTP